MKFVMNGGLIVLNSDQQLVRVETVFGHGEWPTHGSQPQIGTMDGANIEIREECGWGPELKSASVAG